MKDYLLGQITGISIGLVIGVVLAPCILYCINRRRGPKVERTNARRTATLPICVNGVDSKTTLSDSTLGLDSPRTSEWSNMPQWLEGLKRKSVASACGIPKYYYKDLKKATFDFTTTIGQGAFGPVYKAHMVTGETVAVKVLAANSKQGQCEFLTEVLLLARLHHKNLVNLVGYSAERGKNMLVYVYMSNGSLASHLYCENRDPLCWDLRTNIALDVARGLEYLHYGAVPPVVHRDIKSSNILLNKSMKARVSDFGLSRQEMIHPRSSNVRGTVGYLDPEYMSTRTFTKKTDVYSFGVLLFEMISGRNPQEGLMDYVELAAIYAEGSGEWEEIADPRLDGKFDTRELNDIAAIAFKCVNPVSRRRPSMRDIVQALNQTLKLRHRRKCRMHTFPATPEEPFIEIDLRKTRDPSSTER